MYLLSKTCRVSHMEHYYTRHTQLAHDYIYYELLVQLPRVASYSFSYATCASSQKVRAYWRHNHFHGANCSANIREFFNFYRS